MVGGVSAGGAVATSGVGAAIAGGAAAGGASTSGGRWHDGRVPGGHRFVSRHGRCEGDRRLGHRPLPVVVSQARNRADEDNQRDQCGEPAFIH